MYQALMEWFSQLLGSGRATKTFDSRLMATGPDTRQITVVVGDIEMTYYHHLGYSAQRLRFTMSKRGVLPGHHQRDTTAASTSSSDGGPSRSNNLPPATRPVETHSHQCVRCDGRGTIETTDRYGHHVRETCPNCHGSGSVP